MLQGHKVAFATTALTAIALLATIIPSSAESASNASLKGTFPFNETIIAGIEFRSGSPTDLCPSDATQLNITQQFSLTNQGTWSFDGVGRVHMDDTGVSVTVTQGANPLIVAGYSEAHCDGTYQVQKDSTVSMDYICAVPVPGGQVEFDVHANGVITPHIIQVAIPPAAGAKARVTPIHFRASNGYRPLTGCSIVGENTTIVIDKGN